LFKIFVQINLGDKLNINCYFDDWRSYHDQTLRQIRCQKGC